MCIASYTHLGVVMLKVNSKSVMGVFKIDANEFVNGAHNQALTGARIAKDVMMLLNAGFTSVREMAGYGLQIAEAVKEGSIVGPNIYSANHIIVRPSLHDVETYF